MGDVTARWSLASAAAETAELRALLVGLRGGEPGLRGLQRGLCGGALGPRGVHARLGLVDLGVGLALDGPRRPRRHLVSCRRGRASRRRRLGDGRRGRRHVRLRLRDGRLGPRRRRLRRRVGGGRRLHLERRGLVVELQDDVALRHGVTHRDRDRGDSPSRSWHQLRPADRDRTTLGDDAGVGRHNALQRRGRLRRGVRPGTPDPARSHGHGDDDRDGDHDDQDDGPAGTAGRGRVGGHGWSLVTVGGHDAVDRRWTTPDRRRTRPDRVWTSRVRVGVVIRTRGPRARRAGSPARRAGTTPPGRAPRPRPARPGCRRSTA